MISAWWTRWPNATIAIATGIISGLVVLDVDPKNGGDANLEELEFGTGLYLIRGRWQLKAAVATFTLPIQRMLQQ